MIVIDASALLEVLLDLPAAAPIKTLIIAPRETLHAPHLLDIELAQVIRRFEAHGVIDGERGRAALDDLAIFPLQRYPHHQLLPFIWRARKNLTAYDAAYVALAEVLDAPLLTRDRHLAAAARRYARIELV